MLILSQVRTHAKRASIMLGATTKVRKGVSTKLNSMKNPLVVAEEERCNIPCYKNGNHHH
jgi:hypothetical protein